MSFKKATFFAIALVIVAFVFAFVYQNFSGTDNEYVGTSEMKASQSSETAQTKNSVVTPDTATDDLIDEALADRDDLSAEESAEMTDLEAESQTITELNTVYDENENQ